MKWFWRVFLALVCVAAPRVAAEAHEIHSESSGFLHALSGAGHFAGFFILGAMGGFYVCLFKGRIYIIGAALFFMLLASHAHVPIPTPAGLLFALGFLGAGAIIALAAARLATALAERLGLSPPNAGGNERSSDR